MTFDPTLVDRPLAVLDRVGDRAAQSWRPVGRRLASLAWFWQVTLVWAVSRAFTALLVVAVARHQGANPWSPAQPGYLPYINGWDAGYYEQVHDGGYPASLPRDPSGEVVNNVWAFMPVYPYLVRGLTAVTGAPWLVVAPVVSTLASLAFLLVTYRLFRLRRDHGTTMAAIAAVALSTASPVLQFPYAESLALLLVATLLLLLSTGRFLAGAGVVLLLAFTRPWTAPALGMCLIVAGLTVLAHRRAGVPLPRRVGWSLGALCAAAVVGVAAWPVTAGVVTGEPRAYLLTEASWHGGEDQAPLVLFLKSFVGWVGLVPGVLLAGLTLVLVAAAMLSRPARSLGTVMWAWSGCVVGYLALVVPVNTSLVRLALPLFPLLLAAVSASGSRAYRSLLLIVLAATQVPWLAVLWHWAGNGPQPAP